MQDPQGKCTTVLGSLNPNIRTVFDMPQARDVKVEVCSLTYKRFRSQRLWFGVGSNVLQTR